MGQMINRRRYAGGVPMLEEGYDGGYLTLTALLNTTFTFTIGSNVGTGDMTGIYYSLDGGDTWIYTANEANQEVTVTTPLVHKGEYVLWKGVNKRCANGVTYLGNSSHFSSDGRFAVAGDVQSMIWGDEYETKKNTKDWFSFARLFYGSKVKNAKNLRFEATSLSPATYYEMFSRCTMLKVPPLKLQYDTANTGDRGIYQGIFRDCTSLTHSPDILISTLSKNSFKEAFYGCTSLQSICIMSTDISASSCLQNWVQNVNPTGTFIKMIDMTFPSGQSGIPTGWSTSDCIISVNTNPAVLNICYAQGWAANDNYMTKSEAEAVTSFGNVFRSFTGESLMELRYFTSVASVGGSSFTNCSNLKYVWFSVSSVNGWNGAANTSVFNGCSSLIAARYDGLTRLGASAYGSGLKYAVITAESVPIAESNFIGSKFYVLDSLVSSYQAANTWKNKTILSIHQLPTDYPDCPWLDDLREKGFIPTT